MTSPAPQNLEAERATLGAAFLKGAVPDAVTSARLHSRHFYREQHGLVLDAMLALHERGAGLDVVTVAAKLRDMGANVTRGELDALAVSVPSVGHLPQYVREVMDAAALRQKLRGAQLVQEGVHNRDDERIAEGERLIAEREETAGSTFTARTLAERFHDGRAVVPAICPWPWPRLNVMSRGGLRAAQTTFVGGWTSHGKSVALDEILLKARKHDLRTGLYLNEMSPDERSVRMAARLTSVGHSRIQVGEMDERERMAAANAIDRFAPDITDASEWDIAEVCRDIARCRHQVVGVDILHEFDYENEADLRRMGTALARCAKQTGAHIVVTVHLNEERARDIARPRPVLRDIRGSGMLKNSADYVLFVWREDNEETGTPTEDARLYFAKARGAELGGQTARFEGERMRFVPVAS